jgi:hypothetical protein
MQSGVESASYTAHELIALWRAFLLQSDNDASWGTSPAALAEGGITPPKSCHAWPNASMPVVGCLGMSLGTDDVCRSLTAWCETLCR